MTQFIITLIIIAAALITAVILLVRKFRKLKKSDDICNGCTSDCDNCSFYKELKRAKKKK
ncbi:MAG: FeoB-associated Cys-rich membrane protein [Bacteroidales bacterium]|nr:FeoB-associated Cys-rich membrane protein [Bacteroidales bacterium]MDD4214259.1 FeoB-associated Cys-rich membrane protein [Bacteroidales bacterium]